jgi:hypothetical protein
MIFKLMHFLLRSARSISAAALTPVLEKNVARTRALPSPIVVSMSRLIAVAFAVVMLHEFWRKGIDGWPDATLGIATVLALPLMKALETADPGELLAVTRMLLVRLGGEDPSKHDDRPES